MKGDLPGELDRQARALLVAYPALPHRWETVSGEVRLVFPPTSPEGFEVAIEAEPRALRVYGHGFHTHFDWHATAAEAVRDALGLVRDLLSPTMRVRELRAGGGPYRWQLQTSDGGQWTTKEVTAHLFWNYLAPRSERIYQNSTLPSLRASEVTHFESVLGWGGMIVGPDGIGRAMPEPQALAFAIPQWIDIPEQLDDAVRLTIEALARTEVPVRVAAVSALGEVARRYRRIPHEQAVRSAVATALQDSSAEVRRAARSADHVIRGVLG